MTASRVDGIGPATKEPKELAAKSLRWLYNHADIENRPLTDTFAEVLRPVGESLPQANVRAWTFVLQDFVARGLVHPADLGHEVEYTSKALCDPSFFGRSAIPAGGAIPAWTRAVAILTMEVVSHRSGQAPDDRFLATYGIDRQSLRPALEKAVAQVYQEACTTAMPAGPEAFYWLARALLTLDPGDPKGPATNRSPWQIAQVAGPIGSSLDRSFHLLATGQDEDPAGQPDDLVLAYLRAKWSAAPEPGSEPRYLPANLPLTRKERLSLLLGGRPERLTLTGWAGLGILAATVAMAAWGLQVGVPAARRVLGFQQEAARSQAELSGGEDHAPGR
jgi:hypothetical protein